MMEGNLFSVLVTNFSVMDTLLHDMIDNRRNYICFREFKLIYGTRLLINLTIDIPQSRSGYSWHNNWINDISVIILVCCQSLGKSFCLKTSLSLRCLTKDRRPPKYNLNWVSNMHVISIQ